MGERVTSVPVDGGLYVLRYVGPRATPASPHIFVRPSPGCEGAVKVLEAPGESKGAISAPGGCVVVRAERSASLQVTIRPLDKDGSNEAELRLESLTGETRQCAPAPAPSVPRADALASPPVTLEVIGHVSRRGDVRVANDHWVAGPESPAPIEGLDVKLLGTGSNLALEYQVQLGGPGGAWTNWTAGGFAGTRGQARPILAARFRLSGGHAASYAIEVEGLFLGASIQRQKGQAVELRSASGVDPLVGLKVAVVPARATAPVPTEHTSKNTGSARPASPTPDSRPAGRVRVFRSAGLR